MARGNGLGSCVMTIGGVAALVCCISTCLASSDACFDAISKRCERDSQAQMVTRARARDNEAVRRPLLASVRPGSVASVGAPAEPQRGHIPS